MTGEELPKFPELWIFLESYSDESMVSKQDEYIRGVGEWRREMAEKLQKRKVYLNNQISVTKDIANSISNAKEVLASYRGELKIVMELLDSLK